MPPPCATTGRTLFPYTTLFRSGVDISLKNLKGLTACDIFKKYHPESLKELMEIVKLIPDSKTKIIESEMIPEIEDEELSMQLNSSQYFDLDPRIELIKEVFGEKVSNALLQSDKRYKGLRWIGKNYLSSGLDLQRVKALLASIVLGLEEKVHKMNIIALDLLDNLITNGMDLLTSELLEEFGVINSVFAKSMSTTERLLNRILEIVTKIGDLPTVGIKYLIQKSMSELKSISRIFK